MSITKFALFFVTDDSKDADSLSDEATHNSNQNNSNCSSPSRMSDSVSLNTDSSQDISLCSPDKETNAAVLSKFRFVEHCIKVSKYNSKTLFNHSNYISICLINHSLNSLKF